MLHWRVESAWYFDYPNQEYILSLLYDFYRLIFRKEKLTNF